eukprot:IDg3193t1
MSEVPAVRGNDCSLPSGSFVPLSWEAENYTCGRRGRLTRTQLRLHYRIKLKEAG